LDHDHRIASFDRGGPEQIYCLNLERIGILDHLQKKTKKTQDFRNTRIYPVAIFLALWVPELFRMTNI
jgi:hypothetical protein